jgi:hypothetical protein
MKTQIVVLDRGWVYVGKVSCDEQWVKIEGAHNIRRWGTSKGLGELVDGPKDNTVLNATGTVNAPLRALIALIDVNEAAWASRLA